MQIVKSLAIALTLVLGARYAFAYDKVIYGDDNRVDVYESTNQLFIDISVSTAAMIDRSDLSLIRSENKYKVNGSTLRSGFGVCATEPYAEQIATAMCSGFLVGPDLLVTAGHCIRSQSDCSKYAWVFDYKIDPSAPEAASMKVPATSVYSCKEIIERSLDNRTMDDYALIRLDRSVADRAPLSFRKTGKIGDNSPLVVIGHPSGLPTKIADGANVRNNNNNYYFSANLDTYGGNSGSAVFDADNGTVEGILVRGENDFVTRGGCRVSNVCTDTGCRGEDVTRITNIKYLQNL